MSVAKLDPKDYVSYKPGYEDEKALEKRYLDAKLPHYEHFADGTGYEYKAGDELKDGKITTRHIYSVDLQAYFVDTDNKGGRKYIYSTEIK